MKKFGTDILVVILYLALAVAGWFLLNWYVRMENERIARMPSLEERCSSRDTSMRRNEWECGAYDQAEYFDSLAADAAAQEADALAGQAEAEAAIAAEPPARGILPSMANRDSNLRAGPGMDYKVIGQASAGQVLEITGRDSGKDWVMLATGEWIAAHLVDNIPGGLGVVSVEVPIVEPPIVEAPPAAGQYEEEGPSQADLEAQSYGDCDPSYPDVCIPSSPPDLDCDQIEYGRFTVVGSDPHRFDDDNDGIGCEWQ